MIEIRSFRDIVRLYYIFRRTFLVALLVTALLITAGAFFWPPSYTSEARLLVRPGRENVTVPLDVGERQAYTPYATQRDPIIDEEKMLTGQPVVMQVARLYMDELSRMPPPQGWKQVLKAKVKGALLTVIEGVRSVTVMLGLSEDQSPEERLAKKLAKKFSVTHGVGSHVMELSFTWDDPQTAQRVMQTWIKAYTDERTMVLGRKSLVPFYDGKVRDTDQQIESLKEQMRTRLVQIDGISAQERLTSLTRRINDLRDQQAEAKAEKSAIEQGVAYATDRVKRMTPEVVSEREVGLSPSYLALSAQLADLKRQRTDALRVYKDGAPVLNSLNESIAAVEAQLKTEERNTQRAERRSPNELGVLMERNRLEKSLRLQELRSMIASYERELETLGTARRQVLNQEPELARLEQALQVAERSRLLYLDSLEKARIDQALDDNRINNIAVVQQASFSPSRSSPKSLLLLMLALPAGGMVGLLAMYLSALMDQRIHDGGRMQTRFGVPLWSSIKDVKPGEEDNEFHASLLRVVGTLPMDQIREKGLTLGLASSRKGEGVSFLIMHLVLQLKAMGLTVRVNPESVQRHPGEVILLNGSNMMASQSAFMRLREADLIVLVVEARTSLVPAVENALGMLRTAFRRVDGIILNRRRYEVPAQVMRFLQR
jgi:polysaccharide biosynthesis protein PslE